MKIFVCTDHDVHWPVGGASVVVAEDEHQAAEMLRQELNRHGLNGNKPFTLQEIDITTPQAIVLCDGDY